MTAPQLSVFKKISRIFFLSLLLFCVGSFSLFAFDEIRIENVAADEKPPYGYWLRGSVSNQTDNPREVILRAQVAIFDKNSPPGDLPVRILRKDITIILKPREAKNAEVEFFNKGVLPKTDLRIEPLLRLRRQRIWNY